MIPVFPPAKPGPTIADMVARDRASPWRRNWDPAGGHRGAAAAAARALDRAKVLPFDGWPWSRVMIDGRDVAYSRLGWHFELAPTGPRGWTPLVAAIHRQNPPAPAILDTLGRHNQAAKPAIP